MCGFAGVYDVAGTTEYKMDELLGVIRHRGPNEQRSMCICGKRIQIGFARLSIIDLAGGSQPMTGSGGAVTVMCNGEVYNYRELRSRLQQEGCQFESASDTEVALRMYERHGISMLGMLQGMFGMAIIDRRTGEIFLVRDRLGIKPLYYSHQPGGPVGFASEAKPLLRLPFVPKGISREGVAEFLCYEYVQAPNTAFQGIQKVRPGHYLKITAGSVEEVQYWDCSRIGEKRGISSTECKESAIRLLDESMSLHLRSDVPLGVFLSGGIDSGLLAAFAARRLPSVDTFTLRFGDGGYDESGLAGLVAARYHTNHHCYTVRADDFQRLLPEMAWFFDEPLGDSGILPNYVLNRLAAAEGMKVILSGAGGDELFAGYGYYFESRREHYINKFPNLSRAAAGAAGKISPALSGKIRRSLLYREDPFAHMLLCEQAFSEEEAHMLLGFKPGMRIPGLGIKRGYYKGCRQKGLNGMLYTDIKTYLADDLLLLADRSCMAHSIEGRVPFLHHPLVEFALGIPGSMKAPGGQRKWLLKEIARDYLPKEVVDAPKRGFSSPVERWKGLGLGELAYTVLNSDRSACRGIWDADAYRGYVSDARNYKKNFNKIYLLLILEIFFRVHVDSQFGSAREAGQGDIYGAYGQ